MIYPISSSIWYGLKSQVNTLSSTRVPNFQSNKFLEDTKYYIGLFFLKKLI